MVVGRISGVVGLMGFSAKKMTGRLVRTKKSGRNNEVVIRRGFTALETFSSRFSAVTCKLQTPVT